MLEKNGCTNNSKEGHDANPIVIGLTGSFGSGCTEFIGKKLLCDKMNFQYFSLSDVLKKEYRETHEDEELPLRKDQQEYGNSKRKEHGCDYWAKKIYKEMLSKDTGNKLVIDSIRNPGEVEFLRKKYPMFFLFGIYADGKVRWERVKEKYKRNLGQFEDDDKRDAGEEEPYGQRVRDCYLMSDIIISNNENIKSESEKEGLMMKAIDRYISMIEGKNRNKFFPTEEDTIMAMAYANSCRSTCLKRKVGAIIIDDFGNVFSSGYNEVPRKEKTCKNEYGKCYRDYFRKDSSEKLQKAISKKLMGAQKDVITSDEINAFLKEEFKILDQCRALHAEENAILNVVRFGSSIALKGAILYTTTYPCNLCAKLIVDVGIKKIVYLEPYPQKESKKIIENGKIEEKPFEGVLFNGYFRLYGGVK